MLFHTAVGTSHRADVCLTLAYGLLPHGMNRHCSVTRSTQISAVSFYQHKLYTF